MFPVLKNYFDYYKPNHSKNTAINILILKGEDIPIHATKA
jgi:hypothetical protein